MQPRKVMTVVCLILQNTCSRWFFDESGAWSVLLACVQLLTLDLVLCFPVFFVLFLENQSLKLKIIEGVQEGTILQAFTPKALTKADSAKVNCFEDGADSEGECDSFKGKDGHDTDGSLSLGKGKASGRVEVSSTHFSTLRRSAGLDNRSPSLHLALAS